MADQFGQFQASELYCPKCRKSQPVREKLLLVLPSGELHEYLCAICATSLGERRLSGQTAPLKPGVRPRSQVSRRLLRP